MRTNSGLQTIAAVLRNNISTHLKDLNAFSFAEQLTQYLPSEQDSENLLWFSSFYYTTYNLLAVLYLLKYLYNKVSK